MKKVIKIFCIVILIIVLLVGIGFVLYLSGILDRHVNGDNIIHITETGQMWTEGIDNWEPKKSREEIVTLPNSGNSGNKKVYLHLTGDSYYALNIPAHVTYKWDYGKAIRGDNGELFIAVVKGVTTDTLASIAGILKPCWITENVVMNEEGKKGSRIIATLIDGTDFAIVATVYSGSDIFTAIRNSFITGDSDAVLLKSDDSLLNVEDVSVQSDGGLGFMHLYAPKNNDARAIRDLTYSGGFVQSVEFKNVNLQQEVYRFADGYLTIQSAVRDFNKVEQEYLTYLNIMAGTQVSSSYEQGGLSYYEAGNACLGLFSYNSNTIIILTGEGEEARCNIRCILKALR